MNHPPDYPLDEHLPARCLTCGYILEKLETPRCPECGRPFDPADPKTFTRYPGFAFWKYWLPGLALASALGILLSTTFILSGQLGWGLTIATPLTIGCILGYGVRAKGWGCLVPLAFPCIGAIIAGLWLTDAIGVFCGFILGVLFIIPFVLGVFLGAMLREFLKTTSFDQRRHLPIILIATLPLLTHGAQRLLGGQIPIEAYATSTLLPVPLHDAWNSQIVHGEPGPQAKSAYHAGLTRPLENRGSTAVGGVVISRFTKGSLSIEITDRVENQSMTYRFIGQSDIEDRAVKLIDGQMQFEAAGPSATKVTIQTRYQPLVTPRWYWRPFERWSGETSHQYILDAMVADAQRRNARVSVNQ